MLSVVVPVYNEQESLKAFYKELIKFIPKLSSSYEIVFVNDGSSDNSLELLRDFEKKNKNVVVATLRRHQGKAEALTLGFKTSKGEHIVTLDADLQDRPEEIDKLLKKARTGWDLVSGWRKNRRDSIFKIIFSKVFNTIASIAWGLKVNDLNSGLKVYKAQAAKSLNLYGGMHRFIPLLVHQEGFKVTELPVAHQRRKYGKSKYGISKVFTELPDLFTMLFLMKYAKRPMHFFGVFGGLLFSIGVFILLYLSYLRFIGERIGDRPLLLFGVLLVLTGLQIFFVGFIADLVIHLHARRNSD
jgi:glycosyltransferase involved in cell wall biosynthesis